MFKLTKKLYSEDNLIFFFVIFLVAIGIYFRFIDIGKWCFSVDEFYMANSISKILENGVPIFSNGGYYVRGLLFQYFEAFLTLFLGFSEATLRYGAVFFNLLSLPGLYLIGRKIGGKTLGLIAIGIFSISLWEIEFSRFARMYSAFQCLFIWYLFVLIRVIIDKDRNKLKWLYFIAICSLFIHEASIFMVLLLFLPLLFEFTAEGKKHTLISLMILLGACIYLTFNFRHIGDTNYLPQDYQTIAGSTKSVLPDLYFLNTIIETRGWLLVYVLITFINSYFVYRMWRCINLTNTKKTIISIVILLSLMQMYGVCIMFLLAAIIVDKINIKDFTNKTIRKIIVCVGITFSFWFLYGMFTGLWMKNFEYLSGVSIKKILVVLIKYPNIFDKFIYPYAHVMPIILYYFLFSLLYVIVILFAQNQKNNIPLRIVTIVSIICISLIGIVNTKYSYTRYSFFLYPIIIILSLYTIKNFIYLFWKIKHQSLLFCFLSVFLFTKTHDFNLDHLLNISSQEINFRSNYDWHKTSHYHQRRDYKSPSDFINDNAKSNEIIISTVTPVYHYLNKLDYLFKSYESGEFRAHSTLRGTKEFWTTSNLVYKFDDLLNLIINAEHDIWLIEYTEKFPWKKNEEKKISRFFSQYKVYTSLDGIFRVLKITHPYKRVSKSCLSKSHVNHT